jgi:sodium-dependent dicarboxylate transporter 2/3/5
VIAVASGTLLVSRTGRFGLIVGPIAFIALLAIPIPGLDAPARGIVGLTAWMAIWWVTEAVPTAATALLPLIVYPFLGPAELAGVNASYADDAIFLILGVLMLSRAIARAGVDQRLALRLLAAFGGSPRRLVAGFMLGCAAMSAWISAAATVAIMLPVALAIVTTISDEPERRRFGTCLILAVVYASTLGVLSTIIATPPNAVFASLAPEILGYEIGFVQWMLVGVPLAAVSVAICWAYLVYIAAPIQGVSLAEGNRVVEQKQRELGAPTRDEIAVIAVFLVAVVLWATRNLFWGQWLPMVTNTTVALLAALAVFMLPSVRGGHLLDWGTAVKIPWSVLLLMGGGIALAFGYTALGIDAWIVDRLSFLGGLPSVVAVAAFVALTIFVGEIMSNAATAALLIPIAAPLAGTIGVTPEQLTIAVTLAASFGFSFPISAANAVALATGKITVPQLVRAGIPMNLLGIVVVTAVTFTLVPLVFP